jgi:cytoplasmic iron level regulating protein YaaA (DUF328/UPF0246 family)
MIVLLSPAKTLDFDKTIPYDKYTIPQFLKDSEKLVMLLKKKTPAQLSELMEISDDLAKLNHERYQRWKTPVYQGFDFLAYKDAEYERLQKTVRIISGLHGILRPFDLIQAYRLDMHTPLKNSAGDDLYALWKQKVTDVLNSECKDLLVNCASQEYSDAVDFPRLKCRVVTPLFKNLMKGKYQVIGLMAKKARGMFADFVVRNNFTDVKDFKKFSRDGYTFDQSTSTEDELVFLRKKL